MDSIDNQSESTESQSRQGLDALIPYVEEITSQVREKPLWRDRRFWLTFFLSAVVGLSGIFYQISETKLRRETRLSEICLSLPSRESNYLVQDLLEAYELIEILDADIPYVQFIVVAEGAKRAAHFEKSEQLLQQAMVALQSPDSSQRTLDRFEIYSSLLDLYYQWVLPQFYLGPRLNMEELKSKAIATHSEAITLLDDDSLPPYVKYDLNRQLRMIWILGGVSGNKESEQYGKLTQEVIKFEKNVVDLYKQLIKFIQSADKAEQPLAQWFDKKLDGDMVIRLEQLFPHLELRRRYGKSLIE